MSSLTRLRVDPQDPLPIVAQLAEQLSWLIVRGELAEGDTLPATRVLAERLGINLNTVRAAYKRLEQRGMVSMGRGRDTTVLRYDRRKRGPEPVVRSFTIGVIIPNHIVFYLPFLNALEVASTDPSLLFVCNAQQDPANGLSYLDQLTAKNVDGILVVSTMIPADTDLRGPGLPPIVFADYPGAPGPTILFDHHHGSALATEHMLEHGHQRIGFLAPPRALANVAPKYEGYELTMRNAGGVAVGPVETSADFEIPSSREAALRLLDRPDRPTAVVAASDHHAIGVMHAARRLGLSIPDDVALIGNDDIMVAELLQPALTSIHVPVAEMAQQAMAMLQRLIAGKKLRRARVTLDVRLMARRSCGCHSEETSTTGP